MLIALLRSLGFAINWSKVVDLVCLGIRIDTVNNILGLDPNKLGKLS